MDKQQRRLINRAIKDPFVWVEFCTKTGTELHAKGKIVKEQFKKFVEQNLNFELAKNIY